VASVSRGGGTDGSDDAIDSGSRLGQRSDRVAEFVECGREAEVGGHPRSEVVVAAAQVLYEGMAGDDHRRGVLVA